MNLRFSAYYRFLLSTALCAFAATPVLAQSALAAVLTQSPATFSPASQLTKSTVGPHSRLRLPSILSNNAVLQRGRPIHIWGWSSPSESITVTFHTQTRQTTADAQGQWELWLMPEPAGGPYTLTVTGSNDEPPLTVRNVLIGDVWFASGQSNMQIPLKGFNSFYVIKNSAQEIANSNHPDIRLLLIPDIASRSPDTDVNATWLPCNPSTSPTFSAVAYFFARDLQARLHIPIGIIDSAWAGTPISSWMSIALLQSHPAFQPVFTKWHAFNTNQAPHIEVLQARYKQEDLAAIAAGRPTPSHPWYPDPQSWHPSWLWNGMVAPLTPYTIRGFIWYQGETNGSDQWNPYLYNRLFPAMIQDWRTHWHEGNLPFLYVQISSFSAPGLQWGVIRNAQLTTLELRDTGMAVSLDVGEKHNIHPADKQTVAKRLALTAYRISYGQQVEDEGPLFKQVIRQGEQLRIYFTHTTQGLVVKKDPLQGFEIEDANGKWHPVQAVVQGNTVIVDTTTIPQTRAVRYAWVNYTKANLYNGVGLPASTFKASVP